MVGAATPGAILRALNPVERKLVPKEAYFMAGTAPDWDEIIEHSAQGWLDDVPGIRRLRWYAHKARRQRRLEELRQLIRGPQDVVELAAAASLIWYLDSGGRRNYLINDRPDWVSRSSPQPDFLLKDQVSGQRMALEVTRVFQPADVSGAMPFRRKVAVALQTALTLHAARTDRPGCRGLFRIHVGDIAFRKRQLKLSQAVILMARQIAEASVSLREGETAAFDEPFEVRAIKISDRYGEAPLFSVSLEEDLSTEHELEEAVESLGGSDDDSRHRGDRPITADWHQRYVSEWEIDPEIFDEMNRVLGEANAKLAHFPGTSVLRALLITLNYDLVEFLDDGFLYVDRLRRLRDGFPHVDRFYIHYVGLDLMPWTISRVW
jgi:hypothetical protein